MNIRKNTKYTKELLEKHVKTSTNQTELLRKLGLRNVGGNFTTIKKYLKYYEIDISHFNPYLHNDISRFKNAAKPLTEILVKNSPHSRRDLKKRLYSEGLKERKCELCGQTEEWKGKQMSLILDHINGDPIDNRLENLRIVCPNCNATLETHCGKNNKKKNSLEKRKKCKSEKCISCGKEIYKCKHNLCRDCYNNSKRKIERPSKEILQEEVTQIGYSAVGRKYGVSDNSIRKWLN